MKKYIFLDIDGVLCTMKSHFANRGYGLMQHLDTTSVKLLNRLVEETKAELVLSSSWRHHHDQGSMTAILQNAGWQGSIPWHSNWKTLGEDNGNRGLIINQWLTAQGGVDYKYVIIDDNNDMLPDQMPYLILTPFDDGFGYGHYCQAQKILKGK